MKQTVLYKRLAMMFFAIIIMSQAFAQNQLTEQIQRKKKNFGTHSCFFLLKDCRFCEIKVIFAEMIEQPVGHLSSESINLNLFLYDYSVYDY